MMDEGVGRSGAEGDEEFGRMLRKEKVVEGRGGQGKLKMQKENIEKV